MMGKEHDPGSGCLRGFISYERGNCYVPECIEGAVFMEDFLEEMAPKLGFVERVGVFWRDVKEGHSKQWEHHW